MNLLLLDCSQSAKYCGVPADTMRRWLREGAIPGARKILCKWYVDSDSLSKFVYGESGMPSTKSNLVSDDIDLAALLSKCDEI